MGRPNGAELAKRAMVGYERPIVGSILRVDD